MDPHHFTTPRRNRPPFSAFPPFLTNNCQKQQNARRTRFAGRSPLIPRFMKLLLTSEGDILWYPSREECWAYKQRGKKKKKHTAAEVISLIMSPQLWQGQAGSIAAANFGPRHRHPKKESCKKSQYSAGAGVVSKPPSLTSVNERGSKGMVLANDPRSVTSNRCLTLRSGGVRV